MKTLETIMNIWIKICSLVVVGFAIYGIYLAFAFIGLYFDSQEIFYRFLALGKYMPKIMPLGSAIFWIVSCLLTTVFILIFYSPFLYYAWAKKPYIKNMKVYAKIISVIFVIIGVISSWGSNVTSKDSFFIVILILFLVPLYYYAWRKEVKGSEKKGKIK